MHCETVVSTQTQVFAEVTATPPMHTRTHRYLNFGHDVIQPTTFVAFAHRGGSGGMLQNRSRYDAARKTVLLRVWLVRSHANR